MGSSCGASMKKMIGLRLDAFAVLTKSADE
jgi:hypothetical protein